MQVRQVALAPGGTLVNMMSGPRSVVSFVNRYVDLAGRNCCSGKSWAALNRTLQRDACEAAAAGGDPDSVDSDSVAPAEPQEPAVTLVADDVSA